MSTDRSVVPRLCPLVMDNINIPFQQPGNNDLVVEAILCLLHMYTDCGTQKIQLILDPLSFLPPPPPPRPPVPVCHFLVWRPHHTETRWMLFHVVWMLWLWPDLIMVGVEKRDVILPWFSDDWPLSSILLPLLHPFQGWELQQFQFSDRCPFQHHGQRRQPSAMTERFGWRFLLIQQPGTQMLSQSQVTVNVWSASRRSFSNGTSHWYSVGLPLTALHPCQSLRN